MKTAPPAVRWTHFRFCKQSEPPGRWLIALLRLYAPLAILRLEGGFHDKEDPVATLLVAIGTRYHFSVSVWP
jgi:hypothetical protein